MGFRLTVLAIVTMLAGWAPAQLAPGDLIVTWTDTDTASPTNGLGFTYAIDPSTNTITTLLTPTQTIGSGNWVQMAPNNRDVVVAYQLSTAQGALYSIDQTGMVANTVSLSWRTDGFRFLDDGGMSWSVLDGASAYSNRIIRTDSSVMNITTLYGNATTVTLPATSLSHVEIEDNGTFAATSQSTTNTGGITVVDTATETVTASVTGYNLVNTVDYNPVDGRLYATEFAAPGNTAAMVGSLYQFDPNTLQLSTLISLSTVTDRLNWIEVTRDGNVLLGARHNIFKYDVAATSITQTWTFEVNRLKAVTGATVYGNMPLSVDTSNGTAPGTSVPINLNFPHNLAPNANYFLAASLNMRPGLLIGSEYLNLNAAGDPIFFPSATGLVPAIFQDFQGQLDVGGQKTAMLNIPNIPALDNIRVFIGGVALIGAQTVVTNVDGFTIEV